MHTNVTRGLRQSVARNGIAAAAALLLPLSALAQTAPGEGRLSGMQMQAQYRAYVVQNVTELVAEWRTAWADDDLERMTDLYAENAVLTPPGEAAIQGRDAIIDHFAGFLPRIGGVQAGMIDFDASGAMAFISGSYSYMAQRGNTTAPESGTHVTIIMREGKTWRIRFQTFIPG